MIDRVEAKHWYSNLNRLDVLVYNANSMKRELGFAFNIPSEIVGRKETLDKIRTEATDKGVFMPAAYPFTGQWYYLNFPLVDDETVDKSWIYCITTAPDTGLLVRLAEEKLI